MIVKKLWAGWISSWNSFDRLVDWYFIGETWKLYHPIPETQETVVDRPARELQSQTVVGVPAEPLDFTPVTQHLKEFAVDAKSHLNGARLSRVTLLASGSVPKDMHYPESNEDSFAWDASTQRAAVFDGATESFAARRWVEIIRQQWLIGDPKWIRNAQVAYSKDIRELNLSWAQLEAAERGSYTTLASIEVIPGGLQITSIGDSCIFLLEGSQIVGCAPYVSNGEFFASPQAISTRVENDTDTALNINTFILGPETLPTKQLLLATDALSQWLLVTNPRERVSRLLEALINGDLVTLVTEERSTGAMKTDDTTALLLGVQVGEI